MSTRSRRKSLAGADALTRAAQEVRQGAIFWRVGLDLPVDRQGLASAGRHNRHAGVRHEKTQSQIH